MYYRSLDILRYKLGYFQMHYNKHGGRPLIIFPFYFYFQDTIKHFNIKLFKTLHTFLFFNKEMNFKKITKTWEKYYLRFIFLWHDVPGYKWYYLPWRGLDTNWAMTGRCSITELKCSPVDLVLSLNLSE